MLGLGLLAGLAVLGAGWFLSGAPLPAIPPSRTAPPQGFDASRYPEFSALASMDQANVLSFDAYGRPAGHYFLPDVAVTYFTFVTETDRARTVFVDKDGALIDTITERIQPFPIGTFMVTPEAFYAVTANGISGRQLMQDVSSLTVAQLEQLIDESAYYRTFESNELAEDDPARVANRRVHVMRHNGIWKRAASSDVSLIDWKGASVRELDAVYLIQRMSASGAASNFFGSRYRVALTHFDQLEFLPQRSAPFGSPTGIGRTEQWVGTGYYTVFIDNAPIVRFRIQNDTELLSGSGPGQLVATGNAGVNFITLTHTDNRGLRRSIVVSGR
jgi:hypothetical protein